MQTSKTLSALIAAASLAASVGLAQANPAASNAARVQVAQSAPATPAIAGTISMEQAIAIAEKHHPGGRIKDVDMDVEWGRRVYEIEVVGADWYEYDMKIDAVTGKVLSNRRDWFD
ncbi:MAG: PepSY domain-containing protein [Brachymonas sp.]|nr:PepSY domain-containing protein [Brachymonas sp.]